MHFPEEGHIYVHLLLLISNLTAKKHGHGSWIILKSNEHSKTITAGYFLTGKGTVRFSRRTMFS